MTRSTISRLLCAVALSSASLVAGIGVANAQAPAQANGYVQSLGGTVKSGFGLCWRTGYLTPQMATEETDPDLVPKKPLLPPPAPLAPPAVQPPPPPPHPPIQENVSPKGHNHFAFNRQTV